jgi:cyclopropane-fatty-acyl-phospholipid synthase
VESGGSRQLGWAPGPRLRHLLRVNTRAGSKKNIHAHYDLGNASTSWLDETMNYSSALFSGPEPTQDLHAAQQ